MGTILQTRTPAIDRFSPLWHAGVVSRWRVDPWAAVAAVLAVVMVGVYLRVIGEQEGTAAPWFVAALSLGAVGAAYGAVRSAPHRRAVLVAAGLVLVAAGILGILS